MSDKLRWLIGKALRFYIRTVERMDRCETYNPDCPCCVLYRATDDLLEYGSDPVWLDSEKEKADEQ